MHSLERWVVREAIHLLARRRDAGPQPGLSVNISAKAFEDADLLPMIRSELIATSINPQSLTLEITESSAIADAGRAGRFASSLKSLGCRFALDDFGVGFSSLHHLKYLPVDYLKIDGSFIRDLPRSPVDQHLVKAIVDVSRALNKKTVAEFVGDAETVRLLRAGGVDYAQGFHIGRPRAVSEFWPSGT
jgi:EAL domain-containing protein (putative c-di-GMP-specific phosphodiesterase class I)